MHLIHKKLIHRTHVANSIVLVLISTPSLKVTHLFYALNSALAISTRDPQRRVRPVNLMHDVMTPVPVDHMVALFKYLQLVFALGSSRQDSSTMSDTQDSYSYTFKQYFHCKPHQSKN